MKLFVIIDGHSFAYRSFFALPDMTNSRGIHTNALYGFIKTVLKVIKDNQPEGMAVAFDLPAPTFRHKMYDQYKAHRPPSPDELRQQIPLIKEFVSLMDIAIIEKEGFEADDLIGALAQQKSREGYQVRIFTGDRDALQLCSESIHVMLPTKGVSELIEFGPEEVKKKYALPCTSLIDLKALEGDKSDNIPGVAGIGAKTATKLLQQYKTLENIYQNIELIEPVGVKNKLEKDRDNAFLSKQLGTINCQVELSPDDFLLNDPQWPKIIPFLKEHNFNSLKKQYVPPSADEGMLFNTNQFQPKDLQNTKKIRVMKFLLNPHQPLSDEDISDDDLQRSSMYEHQLKKQLLWDLYEQIELPLIKVLENMEKTGVLVSIKVLKQLSNEYQQTLDDLTTQIYKISGEEFNINSPKQLSEILFEKLGLPHGKKTKSGYSTDVKVLNDLAEDHEVARILLQYRELAKLLNTYINALPELISARDGRIHSSFNQTVTATGRLSSTNPNLQNIPIRSEKGKKIRKAFVAEKGSVLLAADYSQIELRILAHITGDDNLVKAFKEDLDIHRNTAALINGVGFAEVTDSQRSQAKAVNFGIAYGMSARKLSRDTGISKDNAVAFINKYFETYPGIKLYMESVTEQAANNGFATTLLGRRRYFHNLSSKNSFLRGEDERACINFPIQGASADIIKIAMIKIADEMKKQKLKSKMILQVHDELVFEVPEKELDKMKALVLEQMQTAYPLSVPLKVSLGIGDNWLEAK